MGAIAKTKHGVPKLIESIKLIMEVEESVQQRLDDFVKTIHRFMQVNVASIYLRGTSGELELSATQGLRTSAIHQTRLKPGEGLVGHVARTARSLNLANASEHPQFVYRVETGEDPFRSFLGVPILRGGRTLGVLVVQTRKARSFVREEVELLCSVAMILADIVIGDERQGGQKAALKGIALNPVKPELIQGKSFMDGLVRGQALLHMAPVVSTRLLASDVELEQARLEEAIVQLRAFVDAMVSGSAANFSRASKEIYESYRMFAYDRTWVDNLRYAVQSGLRSEAAVERVRNEHRARLMKARDPYLRARLHDLEDLANQMLRTLSGENLGSPSLGIPDDAVIFARDIGPAELLDYDQNKIKALVLEEGTSASHTAIICRALGIALVGNAEGVLDVIEPGDDVLVDGAQGEVYIRPVKSDIIKFHARMKLRQKRIKVFTDNRDKPCLTKDGQPISLQLNAGLLVDLPQLDGLRANGIGLFRTELHFMVSAFLPRQAEQIDFYRQVLEKADGRPVTFRTLDLGGDKILPFANRGVPEENPAIGWRAIRITLDKEGLMRYQLRALVAAGAGHNLRLMFPMVTTIDEFCRARKFLDKEVERARRHGKTLPNKIEVGVMLETPSLAWHIHAICDHADFVSVGANDLLQFFFAADRNNHRIADRYDPLHPGALALLKSIVEGCREHNVPVSVCGEIAGRPVEALSLMAIGYTHLSMPGSGLDPVKNALLALDLGKLRTVLLPHIDTHTRLTSVRAIVKDFCRHEGVPI